MPEVVVRLTAGVDGAVAVAGRLHEVLPDFTEADFFKYLQVTAGTLGAIIRPRGGGPLAVLSNNHVLANENRCEARTMWTPRWRN